MKGKVHYTQWLNATTKKKLYKESYKRKKEKEKIKS